MAFKCESCGTESLSPQPYPYHAGFSSQGFLYCESCPELVVFGAYDSTYRSLIGDKTHPWSLNSEQKAIVENALRPSTCGGNFDLEHSLDVLIAISY
jgi:hypothetical protein